jgi:DNA repair protein RecO (recombination protein O)
METAYLLHVRPWRETSQLVEALSQQHGRVGLVARGSRRPRSRWANLLQPFRPLYVSWSGRGGLHTLRAAESSGELGAMTGKRLMAGYYINELILEFTHRDDPHPALFAHYAAALAGLASQEDIETVLRRFEIALLNEVGYGLALGCVAGTEETLSPDREYGYLMDRGPVAADQIDADGLVLSGSILLAIEAGDFHSEPVRRGAKRLLRAILNHHLGGRRLKTRDVMASMRF